MARWSRRELAVPAHLSAVHSARVRISLLGQDAVLVSLADVERVLGTVNMRQRAAKRLDPSLRFRVPGEHGIYLAAHGLLRVLDNMKLERAQPFARGSPRNSAPWTRCAHRSRATCKETIRRLRCRTKTVATHPTR